MSPHQLHQASRPANEDSKSRLGTPGKGLKRLNKNILLFCLIAKICVRGGKHEQRKEKVIRSSAPGHDPRVQPLDKRPTSVSALRAVTACPWRWPWYLAEGSTLESPRTCFHSLIHVCPSGGSLYYSSSVPRPVLGDLS